MVLGTCSPLAFVLSLWKWHISDALTTFESPQNPCRSDYVNDFCFWDPTILGHPGRYGSPMFPGFRGVFWWPSWCINLAETHRVTLGRGGGKQEKTGWFSVCFGGKVRWFKFPWTQLMGIWIPIPYICIYIYIYLKIFRWIVGQRSRNAVALYSMFEFRGVFASGAEKRYLCAPLQWDRWPSPSQPPGSPTAPWRWDKLGSWVKILVDRFLWSGVLPGDVGIIEIGLYFFSFFETKGIAYIDEPRLFTTHRLWSEDVCVRESWTWPWYQFNV